MQRTNVLLHPNNQGSEFELMSNVLQFLAVSGFLFLLFSGCCSLASNPTDCPSGKIDKNGNCCATSCMNTVCAEGCTLNTCNCGCDCSGQTQSQAVPQQVVSQSQANTSLSGQSQTQYAKPDPNVDVFSEPTDIAPPSLPS